MKRRTKERVGQKYSGWHSSRPRSYIALGNHQLENVEVTVGKEWIYSKERYF